MAPKEKLKDKIEEKLRNSVLDFGDLFPEAGSKRRIARAKPENDEVRQVKSKYRDPVSHETWSDRGCSSPALG